MNKKSIMKRLVAMMFAFAMVFGCMNLQKVSASACPCGNTQTIFFVDNTNEQWIKNDNAVMELVDNTNGHDHYTMTKVNDHVWAVVVPASAYNITFNRLDANQQVQWNSFSAGGRDNNYVFYADGSEYGRWSDFI